MQSVVMNPYVGGVAAPPPASIDLRVGAVEDASGFKAPSSWYTTDPLYWTGSAVTQALRFTGVTIPQGATIDSATLTVYSNANMGGATANDKVRVHGEDVDNASQIAGAADALARYANLTTANVDWYVWQANGPLAGADQPVESPDVKAVVQEIVNRASWASGNAMLFFIEDLGTHDNALAMRSFFNGASGTFPQLQVTYS